MQLTNPLTRHTHFTRQMSERLIGRILVPTEQQWAHNCPKHKTKAFGEAFLAC